MWFEQVIFNYNGYSHEIEIRKGDHYIELDHRRYLRIEIDRADNPTHFPDGYGDKIVFQAKIHAKFRDRLVNLNYAGKRVSLIRDFSVNLLGQASNDIRNQRDGQRFRQVSTFYLLKNGNLIALRLKRNKILKALGHREEIGEFVKTNQIDIESVEGLIQVLAFYEKQHF